MAARFETINLQSAKQGTPRRTVTPAARTEATLKRLATIARKKAEQEAEAQTETNRAHLAQIVEAQQAEIIDLRSQRDQLEEQREWASVQVAALSATIAAQKDTIDIQSGHHAGHVRRIAELVELKMNAERQRDVLSRLVAAHAVRTGEIVGAVSLLLAAMETVGVGLGRCAWCGSHRLDGDETGQESHQDDCVVAVAMRMVGLEKRSD